MMKNLKTRIKNFYGKEPRMEETHDETSYMRKILGSAGEGKGLKKRTLWFASAAAEIILAGAVFL